MPIDKPRPAELRQRSRPAGPRLDVLDITPDYRVFPAPAGFRVVAVEQAARPIKAPIRVTDPDPIFSVSLVPTEPISPGWHRLTMRFPDEGTVDVVAHIRFADGEEFWQRLPALERNHFASQLRYDRPLERITLTISGSGYLLQPSRTSLERISPTSWAMLLVRRLPYVMKRDGLAIFATVARAALQLIGRRVVVFGRRSAAIAHETPYATWMRIFDEIPERHRNRHLERLQRLIRRPLFSVVASCSTLDDEVIAKFSRAMAAQVYPQWEVLIAVPEALRDAAAEKFLPEFFAKSIRIIVQGDDPRATLNALASQSAGEFLLSIPAGAVLRANALLELALTLDLYPDAEIIYSDEDRIDAHGVRQDPRFKPAWSPDVFDVFDYFGQVTLLRRSSILAAAGWSSASDSACDHDVKLRIADSVGPETIVHLAKILIHIPIEKEPSGASEPCRASIVRSIRDHCARRRLAADIVWSEAQEPPRLQYDFPVPLPLVSIIIPTRDRADLLETCVRSVLTRTTYGPLEILIVDNDSTEPATHALFAALRSEPAVRVLHYPGPFNYAALNNYAARAAIGSIIGLLNNDCEVTDGDWLTEMVRLASRPDVGCVGCKLLFPDQRVQHAGVQLGVGGIAGHGHRLAPNDYPGYMNWLRMVRNVSAVTGACLLIRKQVFDQVGGMDEDRLKISLNDIDLCLKVRAAGYLNIWTPFAELVHHESVSRGHGYAPATARRLRQEINTFHQRWGGSLFCDPYYSPHLSNDREDFSVRTC